MAKGKGTSEPKVRFSLRWKITVPFIFLALFLAGGAVVILYRLTSQNAETRFLNQLLDSGQQATDAVVRAEIDLLEVLRLVASIEGLNAAVQASDSESLRAMALPFVINADLDAAVLLDGQGTSLLTIRRLPGSQREYEILKGEAFYAEWPVVQQVLLGGGDALGDKYVGLRSLQVGGEEQFALFVGGPIRADDGAVVGVVLVGTYLEALAERLAQEAGANVSIYGLGSGRLLATTLEPDETASLRLPEGVVEGMRGETIQNPVRTVKVAGVDYTEVLTPLVARQGTARLGVLGVSLLTAPLEQVNAENLLSLLRYTVVAVVLVVAVGLIISNRITRPLIEIAHASVEVAQGNLDTQVNVRGSDEIGVLARAFNTLVAGLRERTLYRESGPPLAVATPGEDETLRGRTAAVGTMAPASLLAVDMSEFLPDERMAHPGKGMRGFSETLGLFSQIIAQHGGSIHSFDGETLTAVFGLLPQAEPLEQSALRATHAALAIAAQVGRWNAKRKDVGEPALEVWLGVHSGTVFFGGVGKRSHLQFSALGDTVRVARRVQELARKLGRQAVLITEETFQALRGAHGQFKFGRRGKARLPNLAREVVVHEVEGRRTHYREPSEEEGGTWKGRRGGYG
jgi:class 3 adenylate cyclase